jgi:hypothetical protein
MFHRSYDLSCILDITEKRHVQNAINGTNAACSNTVDAWLYVQQGLLSQDYNKILGNNDYIPKTILAMMEQDNHSSASLAHIILILQEIAQDYDLWRVTREHENSSKENSNNFWNSWRNAVLIPYYSRTPNASRASIGPILEEYLSLKLIRTHENMNDIGKLEQELMNYIGQDIKTRVDTLSQIVELQSFPHCSELLNTLRKRLDQQVSLKKYNENIIKDGFTQLSFAIESRNPIALKATLNPAWYSVEFHSSELYKNASKLLSELT